MNFKNIRFRNKINLAVLTSVASVASVCSAMGRSSADELATMPQLIGASALARVSTLDTQLHVDSVRQALAGSVLSSSALGGGGGGISLTNPLDFHIRLGAMVSPRTKFVGGADVTIPGLGFGTGFSTRVDAIAIVSANIGGLSTIIPLTINEVYSKGVVTGTRFYGGAGIGPYIGKVTRFGGKLFVGVDVTSRLSGELGIHFSGYGDPLVTLEARLPL